MSDEGNDGTPPKIGQQSFEDRLAAARRGEKPKGPRHLNETTAFGIAFRLVTELVSGLVIGGGIGWLLDRWLGTSPWLLIAFFMLGAVAGIVNVFRAAKAMNAAQAGNAAQDGNGPPHAKD